MFTFVVVVALVVVVLLRAEDQRRWHWRELSLTARLREAQTRGEVFERALARLRADAEGGTLAIADDYRPLFDRLTAEARGPGGGAEA